MTQEEKELLLQDICGRLPYGVITKNCKNNFDVPAHLLPHVNGIKLLIDEYDLKPYLRPMSSLAEEEYNEYELTFDNVVVYSGHNNNNIHSEHRPTYETFDYLNSIHVDYRGLIPMGLALEAPEDMYKF